MTLDDLAWLLHTTGATTVLIDGRSGAGKTTLADELQGRWAGSAVVRLEDIYPAGTAWPPPSSTCTANCWHPARRAGSAVATLGLDR